MPDSVEHSANLPVSAFVENDLQNPRPFFLPLLPRHESYASRSRLSRLAVEQEAALQPLDRIGRGRSAHRHDVGFSQCLARVRHGLHKRAVVGKQDEPFAVGVEPSDRHEPYAFGYRDELNHRFLGEAVANRAHDADRLVDGKIVSSRWLRQGISVDKHDIALQFDLRSGRGNDLPIDGHTTRRDDFLGFTPCRHPGVRQRFL